jgi:hypothetical protein
MGAASFAVTLAARGWLDSQLLKTLHNLNTT